MDQGTSPISPDSQNGDDPVIREIPIIHSKRLENMLYLFQYPFRKRTCTNEHNIQKVLCKPENKQVQLSLSINTSSPNFDSGRAELIAYEVDKDKIEKGSKDVFFENEMVDKVLMQSSKVVREPNNYAVAAFNGKEVHLTTVKDIFQFRPTYPYLDRGLKRKKDIFNNVDSDEEDSPQQITVKFRQGSGAGTSKKENLPEPWIECKWHEEDSTLSKVERLKITLDDYYNVEEDQPLSNSEYMKLLVPENETETPIEPALPSHVMSLHALRALPISEQCRLLLKDAQIIQFRQIMMLLAGVEGVTADILLNQLQKVAVLVRGNWVVKSDILYPENTLSSTSGVPAEQMCRARDYVLYHFTKQQYVERKKVASILKIPSEEIKDIFNGIAKLRPHSKRISEYLEEYFYLQSFYRIFSYCFEHYLGGEWGWELSLPTDIDFINKHSDLAQRQNLFWEHRYHQLSQFLSQQPKHRRTSKSASESDGGGSKTRTTSVSCSDNDSGTEGKATKSSAPQRKKINVTSDILISKK